MDRNEAADLRRKEERENALMEATPAQCPMCKGYSLGKPEKDNGQECIRCGAVVFILPEVK